MAKFIKTSLLPLLVVIFLFIPYFGVFGANIFSAVGKFYYVGVAAFCTLGILINAGRIVARKNGAVFATIVIFLLIYIIFLLFADILVDNGLFIFILFVFFAFFFLSLNKRIISMVGAISNLALLIFTILSFIQKFTYFNPNSYAFFSSQLYFWSMFFAATRRRKERFVLVVINTLMALLLTYVIYNSATQLISVFFFFTLFIFRNTRLLRKRRNYMVITISIFALVILLPFVTVLFMNLGIVDETFFTNRGERWFKAVNAIQDVGFFGVSNKNIGAHNGFLEICLKYSMAFGLLYLLALCVVVLMMFKIYRKNRSSRVLIVALLTYVLMNASESFFIGLTDAYFIILVLASLLSISKTRVKRKCSQSSVKKHLNKKESYELKKVAC